jgi:hypothetical protein
VTHRRTVQPSLNLANAIDNKYAFTTGRREAMTFHSSYDDSTFESKLEYPDGNDPDQNAWLTITIRYSLNFVDGYNDKAGITIEKDDKYFALDFNKRDLFPILPWDPSSIMRFRNDFQRGENIWNYRFVLITPQDYGALDYQSFAGTGWIVRPNVLCLFRLTPDNSKPHLRVDVVRLDPAVDARGFRSDSTLLDNLDLYRPTFGHELGHALGLGHIKELLGDQQCIADAKRNIYPNRCYGETEAEKANIMGSGTAFTLLNAKPWLDRIASQTADANGLNTRWTATLDTKTPPRKIPLGVGLVGKPAMF